MQPTGTITFLFTDIAGSTQRWERDRSGMSATLAEHDRSLRNTIEASGGHVFKTVGDAFCAAFPLATAAVEAVLRAQTTLATTLPDLRVRMALHSGQAEVRDGDYFGPTLNRVARLLAVGHGGQVLLSLATVELVRDQLPPGAALRDLGQHRLKDLTRPDHVFQLLAPGLPDDFPPLATLDARPNNLPLQPNALLGRAAELEQLSRLLATPGLRHITLTGPGGTGKTRLALQLAADALDQFPDGVFLVDLAPVSDPDLVPAAVAQALGVREVPGQVLADMLVGALAAKQLLLVLDNFEQVLPAGELVRALLEGAPRLKVLVTSRVGLNLRGEHEWPVPTLALPDARHLPPPNELTRFAAVELFVERATEVKPDFHIDADNAAAVAEICARLDGLPLAIELAATRVRMLPPQALLERLAARLKLLTGGRRDLPERQQTMRAAIAWSYELLTPDDQRAFRRLGVFVGGWSLAAAEAIVGAAGEVDVLAALDTLVANHLVRARAGHDGEARFDMLETIREFALEQLTASGERERLRERHAEWFAELARTFEHDCYWQGREAWWVARLSPDHENFRAALTWGLSEGERRAAGVRIAAHLPRYWVAHSDLSESGAWLTAATEPRPSGSSEATGDHYLAVYYLGDYYAWHRADIARANRLYATAEAGFTRFGNELGLAWIENGRAIIATTARDLATAEAHFRRSVDLKRPAGSPADIAVGLANLAEVRLSVDDPEEARALLTEALALTAAMNPGASMHAEVLKILAHAERMTGHLGPAATLLVEALGYATALGNRYLAAKAIAGIGLVAGAGGDHAASASLTAAARHLMSAVGAVFEPLDSDALDEATATARAVLPSAEFEARWANGAAMDMAVAAAYAREVADAVLAQAGSSAEPGHRDLSHLERRPS